MKEKIKINFSEEDLQDLQNGETFNWTYTTDKGTEVEVHLYNGYDDNGGKDCTKCGLPIKIYMCKECENYGEEKAGECANCDREKTLDKDYHDNCN